MSVGVATAFAIVGAFFLAAVVTVMQKRTSAKVIGYIGCILLAVAPLTNSYAPLFFGAFLVAIVVSGIIGHHDWSHRVKK